MGSKKIQKRLASLYETAPTVPLSEREKWVIVSDLHMGNGKGGDDFRINADLFANALEKHYLRHGFGLVLNGDVEELLRFSRKAIARSRKENLSPL